MKTLHFKFMAFFFKIRDFFNPPLKVLEESDIREGFTVLDYGCGPGSFSIAAAKLAGQNGRVYALDINPSAVNNVQKAAFKENLDNIKTIQSNRATGLEDNSVDTVLLLDTYHALSNPAEVLKELHRVLKPGAELVFSDHHMDEKKILTELTEQGLFKLSKKGKKLYVSKKV